MSLEISTQERQTTHFVGVPVSARFSEFGASGGPNEQIPRIYQWLAEHEAVPLGGPLYIYRHLGSNREEPVDLTVAVPVPLPLKPTRGLVPGSLPAGTYVVGRHAGSPDGIAESCVKVGQWAKAHGYRLEMTEADAGAVWVGFAEHYLTNPEEEADPTKWMTELLFKTV